MKEIKYTLGQKIEFDSILQRCYEAKPVEGKRYNIHHKTWKPVKRPNSTGIVIGIRCLSNGINNYNFEEPIVYEPKEFFKALLVVCNLKEKPVLIPYPAE